MFSVKNWVVLCLYILVQPDPPPAKMMDTEGNKENLDVFIIFAILTKKLGTYQ
jgi:hypothetical protein